MVRVIGGAGGVLGEPSLTFFLKIDYYKKRTNERPWVVRRCLMDVAIIASLRATGR